MKKILFSMFLALAIASVCMAGPVPPITVSAGDSFTVDYIGYIDGVLTSGLTAQATFSGFTFTTVGSNTQVDFNISINNNSSSPITASRVSALGFATTPNLLTTPAPSVSGVFNVVGTPPPSMPQPEITTGVEFCFTTNNCAGGASGGVTMGNTGNASATLYFAGADLTSITFDALYVRYQSIDGPGFTDKSGVGTVVPEPGFYGALALGLSGLAIALSRRKKQV